MMHKSYNVDKAIGSAIGDGAKVETHHHHHNDHKPEITFPISNVTQENLYFVGREAQLAALAANEEGPLAITLAITQAVAGLGGVGKSQLLRQFTHLHREQYDIIWWVRVDEAWAEDMIALGRRLQLPVDGLEQAAAVEMVRSWLCGSAQRWLLLADNADLTPPQELYPRLPSNPQGRVLISSRNPDWGTMARVVTLGVFTPAESGAFWAARLEEGAEAEQAARARLAEELGDLPLALEHAAAYMEAKGKGAEAYLRLYQKQRRKLWGEHTHPPTDYHATVATTWQLSFAEVQKTAGAAELLAVCAFLAADDLPLPRLWEALDGLDAEDVPEQLRPLWRDELAQDEAVGTLHRYSLLTREETGGLGIHRLVQMVYRDQMGETEAQAWVGIAVDLLLRAWPFDENEMSSWAGCGELLPHLQAVAASADSYQIETDRVANLNEHIDFYLGSVDILVRTHS